MSATPRVCSGNQEADARPVSRSEQSTSVRQLRELTRLLQPLTPEWTVTGKLRRLVDAACEAVGAQYVAFGIMSVDGAHREYVFSPVGRAGRSEMEKILAARDVDGLDRPTTELVQGVIESDDDVDDVSFLVAPMTFLTGHYGTLFVMSQEGAPPFTALDRQVVISLVQMAASGIEIAIQHEEALQRQGWLRAAGEISQLLAGSSRDQLEVWQLIAARVHHLAAARTVTIAVPVAGDSERVRVLVAEGLGADDLLGVEYKSGDSVAGEAMASGRGSLSARHLFCVHELVDPDRDLGQVMAVPLVSVSGPRGAIVVSRRTGDRPFRPADLSMAEDFASQAVIALERADAQHLQHRLDVMADRDRIAQDLHDHVIQSVFATGMGLYNAANILERTTAPPAIEAVRDKLRASVRTLDDTIRQIRSTINGLQSIDSRRVIPRVEITAVLAEIEPLNLPVTLTCAGPLDDATDGEIISDFTAVLREALTNVHKHAQATAVSVEIEQGADVLSLTVADNGVGLRQSTRRSGLANLRSRAARHGGTCSLSTPDTGGLVLRWSIPHPVLSPSPHLR